MVMWATVVELEDLIGAIEDTAKAERLIARATAIVAQYIGWPLVDMAPTAVPPNVHEAIITLASRAMTATAGGGDIAQETMGGYSYRLTSPPKADSALFIGADVAALLRPYRGATDNASVSVCDCTSSGRYYGNRWMYFYGPDTSPLTTMWPFSPPLVGHWENEQVVENGETIITVNVTV